jgi:sulfur-carrier protein
MKIELKLYAGLEKYLSDKKGQNRFELDLSEGTNITSLLEELTIPPQEAKIIFLNGLHAKGDEPLRDGDRVGIFPPLGGG